jgi:phosphoribosylamine--glycine ligase
MSADAMKVLVIGGGGREHALCWKIRQSPLVREILCAPGNAGTAKLARNVPVAAKDIAGLVALAVDERVDLAVVGPEEPLCAGIADRLTEAKIPVFGPGAAGARLEGSKVFAKEFLVRHRIPTAAHRRFDRSGAAKSYLEGLSQWPQVIKADGLAGGKGVFVVHSAREGCAVVDSLMEERRLGESGAQLIVEEHLSGEEVSVLAITDGEALLALEPVMDHKQVGEGDSGPNTGGMGVYSPVPILSRRVLRQIEQHILVATLHGMRRDEIEFRGVLFVGLMLTESGPKVLEYNCRFGDPEVQAVVRRMRADLVPYLAATAQGKLSTLEGPEWDARACVGVVAASEGYPAEYKKGDEIRGLDEAEKIPEVVVFHAGTRLARPNGPPVTDGGRVVCVTALGDTLVHARERAYAAYDKIQWEGKFCRRDIGVRHEGRRAPPSEPSADAPARRSPLRPGGAR